MKKIISFILGIILLFPFLAHVNVYADEKTPSCTTYIEESTHKVRVENLSPGKEYQIWIVQTIDWGREMGTEYSGVYFKQPQDSSTYKFTIQVGKSWKEGDYEVEINTFPSTTFLRRGKGVASCSFYLYGYEEIDQEKWCCPSKEYSDKMEDCGFTKDLTKYCCTTKWMPLAAHEYVKKVPCSSVSDSSQYAGPITCNGGEGIETALGCIPTEPGAFTKFLLGFAIGIGGGIAFLLMIFGGLQIIFSGGNPDKVKAGKEIITAALGGLLLIIFAVFILRLIGYDILKIPGFGG